MDPHTNDATGSGVNRPGNDLGQLPPIHAPQSFHAPDTTAPQFPVADKTAATVASDPQAVQEPASPAAVTPVPVAPATSGPAQSSAHQRLAEMQASAPTAAPADDVDTAFDEEWVGKARQVVEQTHADPYIQSQTLSKLKAQYIKARYNKDVKVSED